MAADFFLGESLVGDGNEVAHIDLIIGSKSGPAGAAFTQALSNQKDGFSTLLAVVTPNLPAKPDPSFHQGDDHGSGQWCNVGPAQAAVARASSTVESASSRALRPTTLHSRGVFIHWQAENDKKIYDFNYQATKESIQRALASKPSVDEVITGARTAKHPFASNAERKHGVGV